MQSVKERNMWLQVLLMIVTFGIYSFYWFYQTAQELKMLAKDEEASPTLWTVLLIVPFGCIYSYYKYLELYLPLAKEKIPLWIMFILFIVLSPVVWFLVQRDLNQFARNPKL